MKVTHDESESYGTLSAFHFHRVTRTIQIDSSIKFLPRRRAFAISDGLKLINYTDAAANDSLQGMKNDIIRNRDSEYFPEKKKKKRNVSDQLQNPADKNCPTIFSLRRTCLYSL